MTKVRLSSRRKRLKIEDFSLDRDVERRGWLVQQQHLGRQREGAGDGDALALAAGQFVRVAELELCRKTNEIRSSAVRARVLSRPLMRMGSAICWPIV